MYSFRCFINWVYFHIFVNLFVYVYLFPVLIIHLIGIVNDRSVLPPIFSLSHLIRVHFIIIMLRMFLFKIIHSRFYLRLHSSYFTLFLPISSLQTSPVYFSSKQLIRKIFQSTSFHL
jgi:glucan phosphoethanolaminetransferase (alkaline phosphatase superfamily)